MCNGVGPMYFQCAWTARTSHTAFTFPKKEFVSDYYFLDVDVVAQRSLNACEYLCGWSLYYERISSRDAISHRQYTVFGYGLCVYLSVHRVCITHSLGQNEFYDHKCYFPAIFGVELRLPNSNTNAIEGNRVKGGEALLFFKWDASVWSTIRLLYIEKIDSNSWIWNPMKYTQEKQRKMNWILWFWYQFSRLFFCLFVPFIC